MNNFQLKTIAKSLDAINEVTVGMRQRHKITEWERGLVIDLNDKPDDYELSESQNHYLNQIRQKI